MSLIPLCIPMHGLSVSSTSLTVLVPASTRIAGTLFHAAAPDPPSFVADLVSGLGNGVPLDRPEEMLMLAEEVLARPTGYPVDWAKALAEESSRFND